MKTMTTAEFTKSFAGLSEPVSIRRYTKVIGTYYPEGFQPSEAPPQPTPPQLTLDEPIKTTKADLVKQIEALEADNRHLKQLLAARSETVKGPGATRYVKGDIVPGDPFAALPKQDREFFERKLGKKK